MEAGMHRSTTNAGRSTVPSELQRQQVVLMSAAATYIAALPVLEFPAGVDTHWETQNRMVWNDRQHTSEEHEFVYEVSWIAELGAWRRFLRSQRPLKG
jgi:hypothetical protein